MKMINKSGGRQIKLITFVIIAVLLILIVAFFFSAQFSNIFYQSGNLNYASLVSRSPTGQTDDDTNSDLKINTLPLQIIGRDNFQDYHSRFFLPKDTTISISAVGEAADYSTNPFLFNSYDNDGIELFFDMKNTKVPLFDLGGYDRQYRILWKTLHIDGKNFNKTGLKVTEKDLSLTTYIIDVSFPWKSLGYVSPKNGSKLGFDAAIMDNDGGAMKGKLNWHNKTDDGWHSTAHYGTIILANKNDIANDSDYVVALKRTKKLFKNNSTPLFSLRAPFYRFKYVTVGYVTDSLDLSGRFKVEWDERNLYFRFFVRDNFKNLSKALFDYGWIEDDKARIVWKMNVDELKYAGGALKNKRIDTVISLKKGYYYLKYHTDESHAPGKWDSPPPQTTFYGIKIAYAKSY
ncbi:MAG TPA: sugar-binding protein [Chryseobacterium sp.]